MNVKDLKEYLDDVPDDYDIELSKFLNFLNDGGQQIYDVIFDIPIVGIAKSDHDKHIRFIFKDEKEAFEEFGGKVLEIN